MKIPAALPPLLDIARREPSALLKLLQVGQTLPAKVVAELNPGLLRLQIAATELLARSQVRLPAGTSLTLQVVKGHPLPELRILHQSGAREQREQLVRSAMSRQLPTAEVRQSLAVLRSQPQPPQQAEAVQRFASVLEASGVRLDQLNPTQLRRAIALSGLFHEARLMKAPAQTPGDTKGLLLQLFGQLRTTMAAGERPPAPQDTVRPGAAGPEAGESLLSRLIRLVEGSVARIQLQQTASLPAEEGQRQAWQLDLPIHHPEGTDEVALRIEREASREPSDGNPGWAVNLVFEFDSIGTLQCRVSLAGERVATTFWCDQKDTQQRLTQRLPVLRDALEAQGLEVVHLAGAVGEPAEPLTRLPMPETLLDEHA